jgi:nitroimidazol reductase NimA-like FMN-containing flavoprotein (pyridoxamine 5'-phosphate oxidase superfamily)
MPYHLRRDDRAIADPQQIERLLADGRFATFALANADEPYCVTLTYGYDSEDRRLYFHVAHEGQKLEWIGRNPVACGTVVKAGEYLHGECAHPYQSVVMRGRFRVVADPAEKERAIRCLVWQQERDAEGYWASRRLDDPKRTEGFTALAFEIENLTAKEGS